MTELCSGIFHTIFTKCCGSRAPVQTAAPKQQTGMEGMHYSLWDGIMQLTKTCSAQLSSASAQHSLAQLCTAQHSSAQLSSTQSAQLQALAQSAQRKHSSAQLSSAQHSSAQHNVAHEDGMCAVCPCISNSAQKPIDKHTVQPSSGLFGPQTPLDTLLGRNTAMYRTSPSPIAPSGFINYPSPSTSAYGTLAQGTRRGLGDWQGGPVCACMYSVCMCSVCMYGIVCTVCRVGFG
jgi:hypothetical protein